MEITATDAAKGKPLSKDETKALLQLIENSTIINNKSTNATNNKLKNDEWKRLSVRFNATAVCPRTPQQLRLKWENLKKSSRKRSTRIRMNRIQTGGGTGDYIPPDDILDRVSSLLGSTATGFTVPYGGDKEPEVFVADDREDDEMGGGSNNEVIGEEATVSITKILDSDGPDVDSIIILEGERAVEESPSFQSNPKRLTFSSPRVVKKKKIVQDSSRTARNLAIAEYYSAKKRFLDLNTNNIALQNEKLTLENEKLKLEIAKLRN